MHSIQSYEHIAKILRDIPPDALIIVDLDRTLATENLNEVLWFRASLWNKVRWLLMRVLYGDNIANIALADSVPLEGLEEYLRGDLVDALQRESLTRAVVLATGAPKLIADYIAGHMPFLHCVISSDPNSFCIAEEKLRRVREEFGESRPFAYFGDSDSDLVLWTVAVRAIVVLSDHNKRTIADWKVKLPELVVISTIESHSPK